MNPAGLNGASYPFVHFGLQATPYPSAAPAAWSLSGDGAFWPYGQLPNANVSPSFSLPSPSFLQTSPLTSPGGFAAPMLFLANAPSFLPPIPVGAQNTNAAVSATLRGASESHRNEYASIDAVGIDLAPNSRSGPVPASTPATVCRCHQCDFTTKSVEELGQHWDTAHKSKHVWLNCPQCAYRSRSMTSMMEHGKAVHNEIAPEVSVRRMEPGHQSQEKTFVGEPNKFLKRRGPNILRADSKHSKAVSKPIADDGRVSHESDDVQRAPTDPAVSSGCETPDLPSALVIDERDNEWDALEQQLQQSNQRNKQLQENNGELAELVKQLEKKLAEKDHLAKEKDALLETLSDENAQLNSYALRLKEAQQQLFVQQKHICAQITQQLQAAMQKDVSTPLSPLKYQLETAVYYVNLLQQSPAQLAHILQTPAPNPEPSMQQAVPSCLLSPPHSR